MLRIIIKSGTSVLLHRASSLPLRLRAISPCYPNAFTVQRNKYITIWSDAARTFNTSERVFSYTNIYQLEKNFLRQRKRIAHKLGNPRLDRSPSYAPTLESNDGVPPNKRHFYVMQFLGHRKIENTLLYVQLVNSIFQDNDDQYICKLAKNARDATKFIELSFDHVTGEYADGRKLFKKKKLLYLGSKT